MRPLAFKLVLREFFEKSIILSKIDKPQWANSSLQTGLRSTGCLVEEKFHSPKLRIWQGLACKIFKGCRKKQTNSIFRHYPNWGWPPSLPPYFRQIYFWQSVDHVDLPPSPRIFDKNRDILDFEFTFSIILITFWGTGVQSEWHRVPWLGQIE